MLVADGIQACVTLQKDGGTNPTCAEKGEIQLKNNYAMVLGKVMGTNHTGSKLCVKAAKRTSRKAAEERGDRVI